jgi:hypothetical protein
MNVHADILFLTHKGAHFRLIERNAIDLGQHRGYFDLYGRWQGLQLVMDDRGGYSTTFRSGLWPEHAS